MNKMQKSFESSLFVKKVHTFLYLEIYIHTEFKIFHNQVCLNSYKGMVSIFLHETLHENCPIHCLNYAGSSRDIECCQTEYWFFSTKYFPPKRQQIHIFAVVTKPTLCLGTISINSALIPI